MEKLQYICDWLIADLKSLFHLARSVEKNSPSVWQVWEKLQGQVLARCKSFFHSCSRRGGGDKTFTEQAHKCCEASAVVGKVWKLRNVHSTNILQDILNCTKCTCNVQIWYRCTAWWKIYTPASLFQGDISGKSSFFFYIYNYITLLL